MRCSHCAGTMRAAPSLDHLVCEYCGAHAFPTESEDGVAVLGAPTDHACPVCQRPLVAGRLDGILVEHCANCEGFLLAQRDLAGVIEGRRGFRGNRPLWREPVKPIDPAAFQRRLPCPRCGGHMLAEPYLGPGAVLMDVCLACNQVWLDRGEITSIERA